MVYKKIRNLLKKYNPMLVFVGLIVSGILSFLFQNLVIIPSARVFGVSKLVQIIVIVFIYVFMVGVWLFFISSSEDIDLSASVENMISDDTEKRTNEGMLGYHAYSQFKMIKEEIKSVGDDENAIMDLTTRLMDLYENVPQDKKWEVDQAIQKLKQKVNPRKENG
ncbi:hypothetical protein D6745_03595 [Candidatus Woesearchaeota archaeon]|nr:MAG: hypothetical protein D6745_03595 [Candidatus Woesearchaeota archaeon]